MTTLIVDNYDSFTWNLYQLVGSLGGEPLVVRNDEITLDEVLELAPRRIVLSPGPGDPHDRERIGICHDILENLDVPILGVCLGHQAIVCVEGGRIVRAPRPMHGKTSLVEHEGEGIFRDLPNPIEVMRYHSLVACPQTLPSTLRVTAWTSDGIIMGLAHKEKPIVGVQFHPESIGTPHGAAMVRRFLES